MKTRLFIATAALAMGIVATPALAQQLLTGLGPDNLGTVIGDTVLGAANARIGVVSGVDPYTNTVTVVGRHGELAHLSTSLVGRDGELLRAPSVTAGLLKFASNANLAKPGTILGAPSVIIVEPPAG